MRSQWSLLCLFILFLATTVAACSRQPDNQVSGYIEGRYTYMATSVPGVLTELLVDRGSTVKKGQKLFTLEPQPESDVYAAAKENLQQSIFARNAIADNLNYAKLTFERYKLLVPKNAVSQSQLDSAQATYTATVAQLAQANATIASSNAALTQSRWTSSQKIVYAPVDAIVFDTYYRLGEYTVANQTVLSLLAPENIKAIFYVDEKVLGRFKLGGTVTVQCDGCKKAYTGHVSFIAPSAEYTPPIIYSNETNEKLVYRIEAEFAPKDAYNLHPGQPVTVTYARHDR
jgi:HlyD family secretion protein